MNERLNALKAAIEAAGYEPFSYSGRFMYGEQCIAFDCDNMITATAKIIANDHTLTQEFELSRWDNMGKGWVVYFPHIEYKE